MKRKGDYYGTTKKNDYRYPNEIRDRNTQGNTRRVYYGTVCRRTVRDYSAGSYRQSHIHRDTYDTERCTAALQDPYILLRAYLQVPLMIAGTFLSGALLLIGALA